MLCWRWHPVTTLTPQHWHVCAMIYLPLSTAIHMLTILTQSNSSTQFSRKKEPRKPSTPLSRVSRCRSRAQDAGCTVLSNPPSTPPGVRRCWCIITRPTRWLDAACQVDPMLILDQSCVFVTVSLRVCMIMSESHPGGSRVCTAGGHRPQE